MWQALTKQVSQIRAAEFNMNYSKWQGVKNPAINLNGKLAVREALRQATEEINKILIESYLQA